jgi:hypothetical protein
MRFLVLKLLLICGSECGAWTQEKEDVELFDENHIFSLAELLCDHCVYVFQWVHIKVSLKHCGDESKINWWNLS